VSTTGILRSSSLNSNLYSLSIDRSWDPGGRE